MKLVSKMFGECLKSVGESSKEIEGNTKLWVSAKHLYTPYLTLNHSLHYEMIKIPNENQSTKAIHVSP